MGKLLLSFSVVAVVLLSPVACRHPAKTQEELEKVAAMAKVTTTGWNEGISVVLMDAEIAHPDLRFYQTIVDGMPDEIVVYSFYQLKKGDEVRRRTYNFPSGAGGRWGNTLDFVEPLKVRHPQ